MSVLLGVLDLVFRLAVVMIAVLLFKLFTEIYKDLREVKKLRLDQARMLEVIKTHQRSIDGLLRLVRHLSLRVDQKAERSELGKRVSRLINNLN